MTNHSHDTRREQVLHKLQETYDWTDGPDLANEQVGGSEGLKRLRELRMEGYRIEMRQHPDKARSIWQYRLIPDGDPSLVLPRGASRVREANERGSVSDPPRVPRAVLVEAPVGKQMKYEELPRRISFGEAIPCPGCEGKKSRMDPLTHRFGPCARCNGFGIVPT